MSIAFDLHPDFDARAYRRALGVPLPSSHRGLVAQMERNQRRRDAAKGKGPASRVARMAIAQREGRRPRPL
jgi:hypothetical protein